MAKDVTLQVRMDEHIKNEVEELYQSMGTSFAEAVRIFASQSLEENGMPFTVHVNAGKKRRLGIANGQYSIPDDIDFCNDEIATLFGVE